MSNLHEIAGLENTVQVSARRFEESPYIAAPAAPKWFEAFMQAGRDQRSRRRALSR